MEKPPPRPAAAYATMYPQLCEVARPLGYALALHGSLQRDMDLLAAPWVENAVSGDELARALCEAVDGVIVGDGVDKPHGRHAWTIIFQAWGHGFIDLSIMPLRKQVEPQ